MTAVTRDEIVTALQQGRTLAALVRAWGASRYRLEKLLGNGVRNAKREPTPIERAARC